jgi:MFS family permease
LSDDIRSPAGAHPATIPVVLAGFSGFLGFYATQPLLPLFGRVFHASNFAVSLTVTAPTLAVAAAAPLVGRLGDRWGRRRVVVSALFAVAATAFLTATSRDLNELIAWRFLQGLVTPGIIAVTVAYIHDQWLLSRVGAATAAYVTGTVVGGFLGRTIAGFVAAEAGWRASFVALGALNLACAVIVWRRLPSDHLRGDTAGRSPRRGSLVSHLSNRALLVTYAVGFCVLFTQVAIFTYVTFLLAAPPYDLTTAQIGSVFTVYLVGAAITPLAGRWIDRVGHRTMLVFAMALGVGGALLTLGHVVLAVVCGLALCCSCVFIAQSTASSYLGLAVAHDRGLAVGLYATFYYIGGTVGGALPAVFWNLGGWPACVGLVIAVQTLVGAIGLFFWQRRGDDQAVAGGAATGLASRGARPSS